MACFLNSDPLAYDIGSRGRGVSLNAHSETQSHKNKLLTRWAALPSTTPLPAGPSQAHRAHRPEPPRALQLRKAVAQSAAVDVAALYFVYSVRNQDYAGLLLSDRAPPVDTTKLLQQLAHAEFEFAACGARNASLRRAYSEAASDYWLHVEAARLRDRFFAQVDTVVEPWRLHQRLHVDGAGLQRWKLVDATAPPLPGDEGVDVLIVRSPLLAPPTAESARVAWTVVLQGGQDDNVHIGFPHAWKATLDWHRRHLADDALEMRELHHSEAQALEDSSDLGREVREERAKRLRDRRAVVASSQATLKELYLEAARRQQVVLLAWLDRAGYSTTAESLGLPGGGGLCARTADVEALRDAASKTVPRPSEADELGKPWPPARGADSLSSSLASWVGSRSTSGELQIAMNPFPLELLFDEPDEDDEDEDEDNTQALSDYARGQLEQHRQWHRSYLLPRVHGNELAFYKKRQHAPAPLCNDACDGLERGLEEDAVEDLSSVLLSLPNRDLSAHLDDMSKLLETQSSVSRAAREASSCLGALVSKLNERPNPSPLTTFVGCTDCAVLELIFARLSIGDGFNLRCASKTLRDCEAIADVLPHIVFDKSEAWSPSGPGGSVTFRSNALIGLPLKLVRKRIVRQDMVTEAVGWKTVFKSTPCVSATLVFDAPGGPAVPATAMGPPMRLVGNSLDHEACTLELDPKNAPRQVSVAALSSNHKGAFSSAFEAEIVAAAKIVDRATRARIGAKLEGIRKRNAKQQHFRIAVTVRSAGACFEAVSPPFLIVKRPKAR
jgi:hypothetical protein